MRHADWSVVEVENGIIFVEDHDGPVSVTNDAETVVQMVRNVYGRDARVVYKDTQGEWWEIVPSVATWMGTGVGFKPWNGEVWDILSRKKLVD